MPKIIKSKNTRAKGNAKQAMPKNTDMETETTPNSPLSEEAMARLARIMNDSPAIIKLQGTEWEIRALKPGTMWLIAEEACKIIKKEKMAMGDVIREFALNLSSVARVITLALLNDKNRIFSEEYQQIYDQLLWGDYDIRDWATLLVEILNLIDVDFFFASTNVIQTVRNQTLTRKRQAAELSLQGQSTDR